MDGLAKFQGPARSGSPGAIARRSIQSERACVYDVAAPVEFRGDAATYRAERRADASSAGSRRSRLQRSRFIQRQEQRAPFPRQCALSDDVSSNSPGPRIPPFAR